MVQLVLSVLLAAEPAAPAIAVVTRGGDVAQVTLDAAARGVVLRRVPLPNTPEPASAIPALPQERISAARKAYVDADFNKCLDQVSDDAALTAALGQRDRTSAARVLLWRVACHVGKGSLEPARRAATQLAVSSLQVPAEAGSVSPEVEGVIAKAYTQAAAMKTIPLAVTGTADARVELDGRPTGCSTPCTLEVLEGAHVVRLDADGYESDVKLVRAAPPRAAVEAELVAAAPELAASQWSARYRSAPDADGAKSVRLLSTALRSSRLVMVTLEEGAGGMLQGVLAVDGSIAARAERPAGELAGLMDDLLVRGSLIEPQVPLYKRPLFWIALAAGVAAVAAGTTVFLVTRPIVTDGKLNP